MKLRGASKTLFFLSLALLSVPSAWAQLPALEYDTVYPFGAGRSIVNQSLLGGPGLGGPFQPGLNDYDYDSDYFVSSAGYDDLGYEAGRRPFWSDSDDTLYGKTLQIQPGLGAAFVY